MSKLPNRFCIGRGFQPDQRFADLPALAGGLLALLTQLGHEGMPFGLRDTIVARDEAHASGMCVAVTVYSPEGPPVEIGAAYLFTPFAADARDMLAAAIVQADPAWTERKRARPALIVDSQLERSAA